uniref:Cadherin Y-type LIR-motif domain-containing protein n=1 Tax=Stegastes partitus TaxID=144197 RepID=A0A3B5A7U7_9TELE
MSFQRRLQDVYVLPVVVEDSGYPAQSSTTTVTIRVCSCEAGGSLLTCSAEAIFLPVGLSTGALMAILLCVALLMVMSALYMGQRRHKQKDTLMTSKEDIRDNVIHYDDEGGGEADTHAFDMGTLRNTHSQRTSTHKTACVISAVNGKSTLSSRGRVTEGDAEMIREFIEHRLVESGQGYAAPPYDSLATYAYEGDGSVAGSLSSIEETFVIDESGDFSSLGDWGQPFKTLASILDRQPPTLSEES